MLSKIKEKIKSLLLKDVIFYHKNKPLLLIPYKIKSVLFTSYDENFKNQTFISLKLCEDRSGDLSSVFDKTLKKNILKYEFYAENMPYFDGEYPTRIDFYKKTKNIKEFQYVNYNGLGGTCRQNAALPVVVKFYENGNIEYEQYQEYSFGNLPRVYRQNPGLGSCWTFPYEVGYTENGIIIPEKTRWIIEIDKEIKEFSYFEYKEFLKNKEINIDDFKNFTMSERSYIEIFINPEKYKDLLTQLNITKEDFDTLTPNQISLLKMSVY